MKMLFPLLSCSLCLPTLLSLYSLCHFCGLIRAVWEGGGEGGVESGHLRLGLKIKGRQSEAAWSHACPRL